MKRREFLTAASIAPIAAMSSMAAADSGDSKQEYLEFRQYRLHVGSKKNLLGNFLRKVGIPAMNRIGIEKVGVFNAMYGPNSPTLYVLMVHKSLDTVMNSASMLIASRTGKEISHFRASHVREPQYQGVEEENRDVQRGRRD